MCSLELVPVSALLQFLLLLCLSHFFSPWFKTVFLACLFFPYLFMLWLLYLSFCKLCPPYAPLWGRLHRSVPGVHTESRAPQPGFLTPVTPALVLRSCLCLMFLFFSFLETMTLVPEDSHSWAETPGFWGGIELQLWFPKDIFSSLPLPVLCKLFSFLQKLMIFFPARYLFLYWTGNSSLPIHVTGVE